MSYQTQWLQTTLTDLEEKMKAIKARIEDGSGSEHKKKSELIKMFKEFGNFYHSLVNKYDELRSNTCPGFKFRSGSSVTDDKRELHTIGHCQSKADDFQDQKRKGVNSAKKSMDAEYVMGINSSEKRNKQDRQCEFMSHEFCNVDIAAEFETRETQIESRIAKISSTQKDINDLETTQKKDNEAKYSYTLDTMWPNVSDVELQITKLVEDNLKKLAELIRRNDEKRETIERLQAQLEELRRENTLLRFSVRHSSADAESNEAYISRPRRITLLFRGCSP